MKIINMHKNDNEWIWYVNAEDVHFNIPQISKTGLVMFSTNANGDGVFVYDRYEISHQLAGTCQFSACKTKSGMIRKVLKYLDY